jgi:hypothetical protein
VRSSNQKYELTIFAGADGLDPFDDNVDVEVALADGSRWSATFFTVANVEKLFEKNRGTGECRHGLYFWASDMILVRKLDRETITETIDGLLEGGEFTRAFGRLDDLG